MVSSCRRRLDCSSRAARLPSYLLADPDPAAAHSMPTLQGTCCCTCEIPGDVCDELATAGWSKIHKSRQLLKFQQFRCQNQANPTKRNKNDAIHTRKLVADSAYSNHVQLHACIKQTYTKKWRTQSSGWLYPGVRSYLIYTANFYSIATTVRITSSCNFVILVTTQTALERQTV